ncbi:hypothetical protein OA88_02300 [Flavobacterium sp. JRM]|nr:hypothetical protein OA88_02300 [Flavobacterium sp. JRM]
MDIRIQNLELDCFYHIYNRGVNNNIIFQDQNNYMFFMKQFSKYLIEFSDVYAYCLMKNHFHFVIKINSDKQSLVKNKCSNKDGLHSLENLVSKQIGKFISSYTQSYNKVHNRHGPLFESPFKRKKIDSDQYLKNVIIYIHQNPVALNVDFRTYKFSSYPTVLSQLETNLMRKEVIELFDGLENFIFCHETLMNLDF